MTDIAPQHSYGVPMLWLTFSIGASRYAIDTRTVLQVVPRVALRGIPGTSEYVVGLLDLGGTVCPVVDLGVRLGNPPCASRLSTRIIVARIKHNQRDVPLGLVAEGVTELREVGSTEAPTRTDAAFESNEILGAVLRIGDDLVQWIDVEKVLTDAERAWLYERLAGAGG